MLGSLVGRRVPDGTPMHEYEPGDYGRPGESAWYCCCPWRGPSEFPKLQGNLSRHTVEEHEDGTITVSPSILTWITWGEDKTDYRWHGFLQAGVWTQLDDTSPEPV